MINKWAEDTQPGQPYLEPCVETSLYAGLDRGLRLRESGLANNRRHDRRETNMESVAQESAADTTLAGKNACPQFSMHTHTHTHTHTHLYRMYIFLTADGARTAGVVKEW